MSYKIIVDSCGELSPEMKASGYFATASLSIDVDDYHVIDDETFNQKEFLEKWRPVPIARSLPVRLRILIWRSTTVMQLMCMR